MLIKNRRKNSKTQMGLSSCPKKYKYGEKAEYPKKTIRNILRKLESKKIKIKLVNLTNYSQFSLPLYRYITISNSLKVPLVGGNASNGKGLTKDLAMASGLAELIERRTATLYLQNKNNTLNHDSVYTTYDSLKKNKIDINFLVSYGRDSKNRERLGRIIKNKKMTYTKYYSLTENCWKFFPAEWHVYFNYSNGFATGNSLEEAVLHGLCEVIERNNTAKSQISEFPINVILTENIRGKPIESLIRKIEQRGGLVKLFNLSVDIPFATIYCLLIYKGQHGKLSYDGGWGTATNPENAAIRAINEAALGMAMKKYEKGGNFLQYLDNYKISPKFPKFSFLKQQKTFTRPLKISGYPALKDQNFIKFVLSSTLHNKITTMNLDFEKTIDFKKLPSHTDNDFYNEIKNCVKTLKQKGYEVLAKEITLKDFNIPTVHIVCPGMKINLISDYIWKAAK